MKYKMIVTVLSIRERARYTISYIYCKMLVVVYSQYILENEPYIYIHTVKCWLLYFIHMLLRLRITNHSHLNCMAATARERRSSVRGWSGGVPSLSWDRSFSNSNSAAAAPAGKTLTNSRNAHMQRMNSREHAMTNPNLAYPK